jgi:hypothetical protein
MRCFRRRHRPSPSLASKNFKSIQIVPDAAELRAKAFDVLRVEIAARPPTQLTNVLSNLVNLVLQPSRLSVG